MDALEISDVVAERERSSSLYLESLREPRPDEQEPDSRP